MKTTRLEAFSDGVLAIILTIMVLELKIPESSELHALTELLPVILSYVLSFIYVGIYWNNHHHLLHGTEKINGGIMWANLHLLFWSLVPFVTGWMGENDFDSTPVAMYGVVMLMASVAYWILQTQIIAHNGKNSNLAKALDHDIKGKLSPVLYLVAITSSFFDVWVAGACYVAVAMMWLIPDRRIEEKVPDID